MLDLPHMQNRRPEAIKRYLEFRSSAFDNSKCYLTRLGITLTRSIRQQVDILS